MLGNQAAPRESRGEHRIVGGKAQVAIQRMHEADTSRRAVEHGDDRLADRRIEAVARLPVRPAIHVEGRQVRGTPDLVGIEPFQRVHVGAGAERAARTREHDDADIVVGTRRFHRMAHVALHDRRPRVHTIRTIERNGRDPIAHLIENMLIGHRALPLLPDTRLCALVGNELSIFRIEARTCAKDLRQGPAQRRDHSAACASTARRASQPSMK